MLLAHPVVYLGFPHGISGNFPSQFEFASPLAKVAHFSGIVKIDKAEVTILDGINNPGFSGGPIYHKLFTSSEIGLVGIINGFKYERDHLGQVFKGTGAKAKPVPDHFVRLNSGLIYATGLKFINALFSKLKTGMPID